MQDDIAAIAIRMRTNALGRLMHGQRELFHSNLLAWFFELLPEAADAVFRPMTARGSETVRDVARERGNLDLIMRWPGHAPLVIENKVFSVPAVQQLEEYEQKTAGWVNAPAFVLLSTSAPAFPLARWRHVNYAELADLIDDALPNDFTYETETMRRYASLARDLDSLMKCVDIRSDDEQVWLPPALLSVLDSPQMMAALQKARAQRVAVALNASLPGSESLANSSLSRTKPLVEVLQSATVAGEPAQVGWQFQEGQFRRAVVFGDTAVTGRDTASLLARESLSRAHPELFWFPTLLPTSLGGRKEFNHFAPNFVYQYVKAPGMTIGELKAAALAIHARNAKLSDAQHKDLTSVAFAPVKSVPPR